MIMTQKNYAYYGKQNLRNGPQQKQQRLASTTGSRKNNSDRPYYECRYDRQQSPTHINDSDIHSFVMDIIQSHRVVVFMKGNHKDPICQFFHKIFSPRYREEEHIAFYYLDDVPTIGDAVRDYLATRFDSDNYFVFVRGRYVPLWHIQNVLEATATTTGSSEDGRRRWR